MIGKSTGVVLAVLLILLFAGCAGDTAGFGVVDRDPDTGIELDAGDLRDADPIPDADPVPDVGNGPSSECDGHEDCEDPEICIVEEATGEATCGAATDSRGGGEACAESSQCASGICLNGECVERCSGNDDCSDGRICRSAQLGSNTIDVCVVPAPCESNAGCVAPDVCVVEREGVEVRVVCMDPRGAGQVGASCSQDAECASNLCLDGVCSMPCVSSGDCSTDSSQTCGPRELESAAGDSRTVNVCTPRPADQCISDANCNSPQRCVAAVTADGLQFVCGPPNANGEESGAACNGDQNCAQNLCVGNVCAGPCGGNADCPGEDSMCKVTQVERSGEQASLNICQPAIECGRDDDCPVSQVCYMTRTATEIRTTCRSGNPGGGSQGQVCAGDTNCAANMCYDGRFRDYCARACQNNADCSIQGGGAISYECQEVEIDLSGGGTSPMQICVARPPSACTAQADCADGTRCAIVPNVEHTALESVCIPNPGGGGTGAVCDADAECSSRVCINSHCAAPCTDHGQCGPAQLCQVNTIQKEGLAGDFQVCEHLPETQCAASVDCPDGVRVCGELRQSGPNSVEAYCTFPNDSGLQLGERCTSNNQCREKICFGGACSVVCENTNRDCGLSQVCATFAAVPLCMTACTNDTSCGADRVCTFSGNSLTNSIDYVCFQEFGALSLGETCTGGQDCKSGMCLQSSLYTYTNTSCSFDSTCQNMHGPQSTCECPLNSPNCANSDKRCADVTSEFQCTAICDPNLGNNDCIGDASNTLTRCTSNTTVALPNGGSTTISTCSQAPN